MYRFVKDNKRLFVQGTSDGNSSGHVGSPPPAIVTDLASRKDVKSLQAVYTKRRVSTEVLGSSLESTKTSRSGENGQRRITTKIVRKITTLSRGEEKSVAEDLLKQGQVKDERVRRYQVAETQYKAIKPKRVKVC